MFRILALAGGGLRGAFAIGVLAELESRLLRPLTDYFDLIAGTSTGAITAAALCSGLSAADVERFYNRSIDQIFHPRDPLVLKRRGLRGFYPMLRWYVRRRSGRNLDHFLQSRYCPFHLADSMTEAFGDKTMAEATRCRLIIPAVNLTDGETKVFRTPHLPVEYPEYGWRIADVIAAATAAPTYFPHKTMPDGKDYADGGLWANDPGLVVLTEASRVFAARTHFGRLSGADLDDVYLLSIGTGQAKYSLAPPGGDAGMLFWASHAAEVMTVSQVQGTQLPLGITLGDRYKHVDFDVSDKSWTLDNTSVTEPLFKLGHARGVELFDEIAEVLFQETTAPYAALGLRRSDHQLSSP